VKYRVSLVAASWPFGFGTRMVSWLSNAGPCMWAQIIGVVAT
jgi:hypothetical protein